MSKKVKAKLILIKNGKEEKDFLISSDTTNLGRWDPDSGAFPDIDLTNDDVDAKISRKHAKIVCKGNQYFLEDLGSLNGSYINRGSRLPAGEPTPVKDCDEVILGKTFFRFSIIQDE